jgi:predicted ATPase
LDADPPAQGVKIARRMTFSVLYSFWVANYVAFNGTVLRELGAQSLTLAEKQGATVPLMLGHRLIATSLMTTGSILDGRAHYDQALALYDAVEHRPLVTRFGQDTGVTILGFRSLCLWFLGYPDAALADATQAVNNAREISQAGALMSALTIVSQTHIFCGNYGIATTHSKELVALAEEKGSSFWKSWGVTYQGLLSALSGDAWDALQLITAGIAALESTGSTLGVPWFLAILARAYADLGQFDDAWCSFDKAIKTLESGKERRWEAEVNRIGGEIARMSSEPNMSKAESYFERALAVAREQQAKSWELRAAMSMARLWRDQRKHQLARELLTPVYGWFTEGFDTLDLKEAKALLDALSS